VIGLPTLRLRGDYIAIVTLAFGEIIRVFVTNGDGILIGGQPLTAGRQGITPVDPIDLPIVRDTRIGTWQPGDDGRYHSADGWHHATWIELHSRYDLVEVA